FPLARQRPHRATPQKPPASDKTGSFAPALLVNGCRRAYKEFLPMFIDPISPGPSLKADP
ncbi:MAG: hypothetical protein WCB76_00920, partial [Acidobacteriaceae bacterium]